MTHHKRWNKALIAFALVAIAGIVGGTLIQRRAAFGDVTYESTPIDGRQDKLLTERGELSKWLLGLSYGTLAALLGLQAKQDSHYRPAESVAGMAACGLLVVSLFEGFLFQQAATDALERDIKLIYGSYLDAPLQLQFYTLLGAVVLLATWFFRPRRVPHGFLFLVLLCLSNPLRAQTTTADCVRRWSISRNVELSAEAQANLENIVEYVKKQARIDPGAGDGCVYVLAAGDELRSLARYEAPDRADLAIPERILQIDQQLRDQNALPNDWVARLVAFSKFWNPEPYATLEVQSNPEGLEVHLGNLWPGEVKVTPLTTRVPPGNYLLELVRDGLVLFSRRLVLTDHGPTTNVRYPQSGGSK